jgi:uncharacterized membrane protein YtjA (UPF0391 family)
MGFRSTQNAYSDCGLPLPSSPYGRNRLQDLHCRIMYQLFPLYSDAEIEKPDWREDKMLRWALIFFIVALVAGVLGFFGIAAAAAGIAKILFFVFLVLFLVSLVSGLMSRA